MVRSFFWHLRKVCIKLRLRGFRRRSPKASISFTGAGGRGKNSSVLLRQGKGEEASYGGGAERIAERIGEEEPIKQQEAETGIKKAKKICVATFNVALFSLAPAIPHQSEFFGRSSSDQKIPVAIPSEISCSPRSKLSCPIASSQSAASSKARSLQISTLPPLQKTRFHATHDFEASTSASKPTHRSSPKSPLSPLSRWHASPFQAHETGAYLQGNRLSTRTVYDVLREADADLVALQEVKADESKGMKPLSELAEALGMQYAFAESWAPEFGNAVLSRWPIKSWHVKKLAGDSDFRNILKVVVDVPGMGELHFCCTHLDHLNESFRWKQVTSLRSFLKDYPHILAGDLNVLNLSDYSRDRWNEIAKFRENNGKMPPRGDVMDMLKGKGYIDSVGFAGDTDTVVVLFPGQEVQGTCKCGTRVDYILASPSLPYKFVPGSYTIVSSKGTSDHHLVKVDIQTTVW